MLDTIGLPGLTLILVIVILFLAVRALRKLFGGGPK